MHFPLARPICLWTPWLVFLTTMSCFSQAVPAYVISTIAGTGSQGFNGDGASATSAMLNQPFGVTVDASGNVYFSDTGNHRIRKVASSGAITTVAGNGVQGFSGDGGLALSANLNQPGGVVVDTEGNVYFSDVGNFRVRKVSLDGTITTIAGSGNGGYGGDGGPATSALLGGPVGLALDGASNLYIADASNHRIRKVSPNGIITTVAGTSFFGHSGDGGAATSALLLNPIGVAVHSQGDLYIAESGNRCVRKVTSAGIISTVAGRGFDIEFEGKNATTIELRFFPPLAVAVDPIGNYYFPHAQRLWRVNTSNTVNAIAGNGESGYTGDGVPALTTRLNLPSGIAVASSGSIYFADQLNHRIRKLTPTGPGSNFPFSWILPSSARAGGLGGTFFTTALTLANTGNVDGFIQLKFLGNNKDGRSGAEVSLLLAAGKSITYSDVLGQVFGLSSDFGAIRISSSISSLSIIGQTSTPGAAGGTYGQSVPASASGDFVVPGVPRFIIGVREDSSFRTNLILANASETTLVVDVVLVSENGSSVVTKRYTLPPLGMTQITRVVRDLGVQADISGARLVLSTQSSAGAFVCYASSIDNVTGDPRTLLAR